MSKQTQITIGVLALQGAFKEHVDLLRQASQKITSTRKLKNVNWTFLEVRTAEELGRCDALIIPGGESTAISLVAARSGLLDPLRDYVKIHRRPVWGTCAGLILLAESANRTKKGGQELIGGIDVRVNRNHFGRQVESFEANLDLPFLADAAQDGEEENGATDARSFRGVFIRAPIVEGILSPQEGELTNKDETGEGSVNAPRRKPNDKMASESVREEVEILATVPKRSNEPSNGVIQTRPETFKEDIVAVKQGNVFGTSFHPELTGDPRIHIWWLDQVLKQVEQTEKDGEYETAVPNGSAS